MISFGEAKRIESRINTYPTHDLILRDDMIEKLLDITKKQATAQNMGKDSIPADIVLDNTVPTHDFYIRVNDVDSARVRVVITDAIDKPMPIGSTIKVVGVVIFDYGVTRPMMFFGVKRRSKQLVLLDDVWWFGAKDNSDVAKYHNKFGLENMSKLKMFRTVMKIWYGIEHIMLYSSLFPREMNLFQRSTFVIYNDALHFPDKIKYNHNPDKHDRREYYYRRKLTWFVIGHFRTYRTNKNKRHFVQGTWVGPMKHDLINIMGDVNNAKRRQKK